LPVTPPQLPPGILPPDRVPWDTTITKGDLSGFTVSLEDMAVLALCIALIIVGIYLVLT
jgi:hypothetical protein